MARTQFQDANDLLFNYQLEQQMRQRPASPQPNGAGGIQASPDKGWGRRQLDALITPGSAIDKFYDYHGTQHEQSRNPVAPPTSRQPAGTQPAPQGQIEPWEVRNQRIKAAQNLGELKSAYQGQAYPDAPAPVGQGSPSETMVGAAQDGIQSIELPSVIDRPSDVDQPSGVLSETAARELGPTDEQRETMRQRWEEAQEDLIGRAFGDPVDLGVPSTIFEAGTTRDGQFVSLDQLRQEREAAREQRNAAYDKLMSPEARQERQAERQRVNDAWQKFYNSDPFNQSAVQRAAADVQKIEGQIDQEMSKPNPNMERVDKMRDDVSRRTAQQKFGASDFEMKRLAFSSNTADKKLYQEKLSRVENFVNNERQARLYDRQMKHDAQHGAEAQKLGEQKLALEYEARYLKDMKDSLGVIQKQQEEMAKSLSGQAQQDRDLMGLSVKNISELNAAFGAMAEVGKLGAAAAVDMGKELLRDESTLQRYGQLRVNGISAQDAMYFIMWDNLSEESDRNFAPEQRAQRQAARQSLSASGLDKKMRTAWGNVRTQLQG